MSKPNDPQQEAPLKTLGESLVKRVDNIHLQAEAIAIRETENGVVVFFKYQHEYYHGAFAFYGKQHKEKLIHFIAGNDLDIQYSGSHIRLYNGAQSLSYVVNNKKGLHFVEQRRPKNVVYGEGLAYLFNHHFYLDKLPADDEVATYTTNEIRDQSR